VEVPVIALMLLAAAAGPIDPAATPPARPLLDQADPRACRAAQASGDVVVCGSRDAQERFRLRPLEDRRFAERPTRAEMDIPGGGKLKAHGQQGNVGGFSSPRAMVTLSWPF
jgi:hypothetical protein